MAITFVDAWRKCDPHQEAEACAFWARHKVRPDDADANIVAKQLAVLAYDDGALIGISTVSVSYFDPLQEKFGFVREFVTSNLKLDHINIELTQKTLEVIEAYAQAHPEEELAGMAVILKAPGIGQRAISPGGRLILMGYTEQNEQVRACWFDHFRVKSRLSRTD